MKNAFLKLLILLCLFSVSILRGQTPAKKTAAAKTATKKKAQVVKTNPSDDGFNPDAFNPVMTFDTKFHDFGTIKSGEITPTFVFNFTNTGTADLHIDLISGCDCSEFDWTRTAVKPSEKGFVSVKFNSNKAEIEDHKKKLEKFVEVILKETKNGYVIAESLKFNVFIAD